MRDHTPYAYECCECGAPQGEYVWRNPFVPRQWASIDPKKGGWLMKKVVILHGGICMACAGARMRRPNIAAAV